MEMGGAFHETDPGRMERYEDRDGFRVRRRIDESFQQYLYTLVWGNVGD